MAKTDSRPGDRAKASELFFSEKMDFVEMIFQHGLAHDAIVELALLNIVEFVDMNTGSQKGSNFLAEIRKVGRLDLSLSYLTESFVKSGLEVPTPAEPTQLLFSDVESAVLESEQRVRDSVHQMEQLKQRLLQVVERRFILKAAQNMITASGEAEASGLLGCLAGVCRAGSLDAITKAVTRATRGNFLLKWALFSQVQDSSKQDETCSEAAAMVGYAEGDINDEVSKRLTAKQRKQRALNQMVTEHTAFLIYYPPAMSSLSLQLKRIVTSYGGSVYEIPPDTATQAHEIAETTGQLYQVMEVIRQSQIAGTELLLGIARQFDNWTTVISREKAVYAALNKCSVDLGGRVITAHGWVPHKRLQELENALLLIDKSRSTTVPTIVRTAEPLEPETLLPLEPPTWYDCNKYTREFQNMSDSNGIGAYREANPGLRMLISFPLLFSVMFADLGHGLLFAAAGAAMCIMEKRLLNNAVFVNDGLTGLLFAGRYLILVFGICGAISGIIFNEFMGMPMRMFGHSEYSFSDGQTSWTGHPYLFGVDPSWREASEAMAFNNSLKMKISVLFAGIHMTVALLQNLSNVIRRRAWAEIFVSWLPMMLFFGCFVIYMCVIIIYKWTQPWESPETAPALIQNLVNMFLSPGKPLDLQLYEGQVTVQLVMLGLMLVGLVGVFLVRPLYETIHKSHVRRQHGVLPKRMVKDSMDASDLQAPLARISDGRVSVLTADEYCRRIGAPPPGEVFLLSVVDAVEFSLSVVSHTASYLRLWAISLAHAQLTEVLYSQLLSIGVKLIKYHWVIASVALSALFVVYWVFTVVLLLGLEAVSAMLHAARLEWIEASGKHFAGTGRKIRPVTIDNKWTFADTVAIQRANKT